MKLYVWTDVLRDYTEGMIVAVAPDLEAALAAATDGEFLRSEMGRKTPLVIDIDDNTEPQMFDRVLAALAKRAA